MLSCSESGNKENEEVTTIVEESEAEENMENFDWLLGNWKRNSEVEGKETFEFWEKKSAALYNGLGYTLQKGDTVKQEKMQLEKIENKWLLIVHPLGEPEPFTFPMYSFTNSEFICKNPELGFLN